MQRPAAFRLPQAKRGRTAGPSYHTAVSAAGLYSIAPRDDTEGLEDIWQDTSLFEVDTVSNGPAQARYISNSNEHSFDQLLRIPTEPSSSSSTSNDQFFNAGHAELMRTEFPALFPSCPDPTKRPKHLNFPNPFFDADSLENRYGDLANRVFDVTQQDGIVNGYIKFRIRKLNNDENAPHDTGKLAQDEMGRHHRDHPIQFNDQGEPIYILPPNFASQLKLDKVDSKIMRFFLTAYCDGRTLLAATNFWYVSVAPMASGNEAVKHAILAFAATYVIDYVPSEQLRTRAKLHYRRAVELLSKAIADPESVEVNKADATIVAAIMVYSVDIVSWETRKSKESGEPLWRDGSNLSRMLLDHADPGYRYWMPGNIQSSHAYTGCANWQAYSDICTHPVTKLTLEHTEPRYAWLLAGSDRDVRKIHGATGVSPKLLHNFAQITHLSARMKLTPNSIVIPYGAEKIKERLENFWQWSDLSDGYDDLQTLLDSCVPDENGKVNCAAKVTDLSAHAGVPAAKIYLHCRFYRKPRSHPDVRKELALLIQCISLLPCSGPLFTSQSPFFVIFLMGMVAYTNEDRKAVKDWFEIVLAGANCRSTVPPVWTALQGLWDWADNELVEEFFDENRPIGQRYSWWEDMVDYLLRNSGVLCLV